jgi:hypothetical protein
MSHVQGICGDRSVMLGGEDSVCLAQVGHETKHIYCPYDAEEHLSLLHEVALQINENWDRVFSPRGVFGIPRPIPPDPVVTISSITEERIEEVELSAGVRSTNRHWLPYRGRVKWFRDELGQLWVKFYTKWEPHRSSAPYVLATYTCHVYPASSVVSVVYAPKTEDPYAV